LQLPEEKDRNTQLTIGINRSAEKLNMTNRFCIALKPGGLLLFLLRKVCFNWPLCSALLCYSKKRQTKMPPLTINSYNTNQ
jgi:hypothetical protein